MEFSTAVHGFHYKKYWDPVESRCLNHVHEKENPYDYLAIKTCLKDGKIVGHLPMEISQSTKSKLDQGALIIATFTSMSYYKLLVQEGLGHSLFGKGLHASHSQKQTNHFNVRGND